VNTVPGRLDPLKPPYVKQSRKRVHIPAFENAAEGAHLLEHSPMVTQYIRTMLPYVLCTFEDNFAPWQSTPQAPGDTQAQIHDAE
jgi:hypothetical protein